MADWISPAPGQFSTPCACFEHTLSDTPTSIQLKLIKKKPPRDWRLFWYGAHQRTSLRLSELLRRHEAVETRFCEAEPQNLVTLEVAVIRINLLPFRIALVQIAVQIHRRLE